MRDIASVALVGPEKQNTLSLRPRAQIVDSQPQTRIMHRRDFVSAASVGVAGHALFPHAAAAMGGETVALHSCGEPAGARSDTRFPSTFWWGAAAAAYQLEGGASADGRTPSIWDTFSHTPGKVKNGDTGDVACDHYHRYKEDVRLMADLGVKHYRFSISWSRVVPAGRGAVNEKGIDFYQRLVDELLAHGITPHATLYHWDLPQALQDKYRGWESREVVNDFADYAAVAAKRLGDRITHWMTLNEILTFAMVGYGVGATAPHAPGLALGRPKDRWQVVHHALLAHGRGCQAIRANSPRHCRVAIAENFSPFVPVIETPEHIEATRLAFTRTEANGAIITPLLTGKYDPFWLAQQGAEAPDIRPGDMETIHQKLDGLGFNCYTGTYVRAAATPAGFETLPMFDGYPRMALPWLTFLPESIYWGIRMVKEALGRGDLPIYITENGCADSGPADGAAQMQDIDRVMYLRSYLRQVQRAVDEGFPVLGYFPWSIMDNFEWAEGYTKTFGLVHVDFATQKRTPKLSYDWYRDVIRRRMVL